MIAALSRMQSDADGAAGKRCYFIGLSNANELWTQGTASRSIVAFKLIRSRIQPMPT